MYAYRVAPERQDRQVSREARDGRPDIKASQFMRPFLFLCSIPVYILFSPPTDKYYTGQTQDIENRPTENNELQYQFMQMHAALFHS